MIMDHVNLPWLCYNAIANRVNKYRHLLETAFINPIGADSVLFFSNVICSMNKNYYVYVVRHAGCTLGWFVGPPQKCITLKSLR